MQVIYVRILHNVWYDDLWGLTVRQLFYSCCNFIRYNSFHSTINLHLISPFLSPIWLFIWNHLIVLAWKSNEIFTKPTIHKALAPLFISPINPIWIRFFSRASGLRCKHICLLCIRMPPTATRLSSICAIFKLLKNCII